MQIGERVTFVEQDAQEGFGHAVHAVKDHVGEEPFLLMLGDHVYKSYAEDGRSCVRQMLDVYKKKQTNVVGLKRTPLQDVSRFGAVSGVFDRTAPGDDGTGTDGAGTDTGHHLLDVRTIVEKPSQAFAAERLRVPGMPAEEILTMFGQYIVSPRIFEILEENISHNIRVRGDFQFTPALERLREEEGVLGLVVDGQRYDIGTPDA